MPDAQAHEQSPKGGGGRRGALRAFAVWWVLCAALWLALIDRTRLDELMTGVVAATLGAVAAVLVRQERQIVLRPQPRWFTPAWRQLVAFFADVWPLARVLVIRGVLRRKESGAVHELDFAATQDTPRDAAFRVFTAGLGSLGPNTIVLDVDDEEGILRAHQLAPTSDPARGAMPLEGP